MRIFLDGSVVRSPASGVHLAVRHQLLALLAGTDPKPSTVFCLDEPVRQAAAAAGVAVGPLPGCTRRVSCRILWQQLVLPGLLRRDRAGLLHALAYTAPLRTHVPTVVNVHDLIALRHPELCSPLNVWHMRTLLAPSARRAAACVVSSGPVADELISLLEIAPERVHVVPLGVDYQAFAESAPRPACLRGVTSKPYVLFVGNLEPKKGLDLLLDAYERVAGRLGFDLVLAGRPAWKCAGLLARVRHYQGPGRIHLLGRVADADLAGLYQHAKVFVFPSLAEGFGLPILEAMAAGTPVLHSDHPVVLETAGGGGLDFRLGDAEELGQLLVLVKESTSLREQLIGEGRERARSLPWSRWADHVREIYRGFSL